MRSYGQYCGLARALDVVGNRWSLLVVRELLTGPARYAQLQAGLPGISPNLLTDRLRELEALALFSVSWTATATASPTHSLPGGTSSEIPLPRW